MLLETYRTLVMSSKHYDDVEVKAAVCRHVSFDIDTEDKIKCVLVICRHRQVT